MRRILIYPGDRFSSLLVIAESYRSPSGQRMFCCLCDCGTLSRVRIDHLRSGRVVSCGCVGIKHRTAASTKHGACSGGKATPEFRAWRHMIDRCANPNCKEFKYYGARGIMVCNRWITSFSNFLEDMGRRPSLKHSIGRINNDRGYHPDNCRWETSIDQNNNRRSNRMVSVCGFTGTFAECCRFFGVSQKKTWLRLYRGWPLDRAFSIKGAK